MKSILLTAVCGAVVSCAHGSWGKCEKYTGTLCSEYDMTQDIFIYDTETQQSMENQLVLPFKLIDTGASLVGDSKCVLDWKELYCRSYFPPCHIGDDFVAPKKMCMSACENVYKGCEAGFKAVVAKNFGDNIVRCDDKIGDAARTSTYLYPYYLDQWKDKPLFELGATNLQIPGKGEKAIPCWTGTAATECPRRVCPPPYVEQAVAKDSDSENETMCRESTEEMVDCAACSSSCYLNCPHPVYPEATWETLWIVRWLPSIISLPFNTMVVINEFTKLGLCSRRRAGRKENKNGNIWTLGCSIAGVLFAVLDGIPTLVMKFDIRCNGYGSLQDPLNMDYSTFCALGRFNIHIYQMLLAFVGVTLEQLWMKLRYAKKMQSFKQSKASVAMCLFYAVGIPLILLLVHSTFPLVDGEAHPEGGSGALVDANNIRYAFSCGPRFESAAVEWGIIMAPIIVYGVVLVTMSALLMKAVIDMAGGLTTKSANKVSKTTMTLAKAMVKFATCCVILVILNLSTLLSFLTSAETFSRDLDSWKTCVATGVNFKVCNSTGNITDLGQCELHTDLATNATKRNAVCGAFDASAPSRTFVALIHLSYSLPALVFGILFGYTAWRGLMRRCATKVASSYTKGPTSTALSSTDSELAEKRKDPLDK